MKKKIYATVLLVFCLASAIAQEHYYWSNGRKYALKLSAEKQYVLIKSANKELAAQNLGISQQEISDVKKLAFSKTILNKRTDKSISEPDLYWSVVSRSLNKDKINSPEVIYAAPFFNVNGKEVGMSQFFYVKLRHEQDIDVLEKLAKDNNVQVVGNDSFMPLWYILSCSKTSKGNAMEMANLFYETGRFTSAQPDFMEDYGINCRNDPFFNRQWHLNNTGQFGGTAGNDTRICQAWDITMGCADVIVAVLDHGLEFNHPDFNNISPISFDTETGTQPSVVRGDHAVAVAGIIGASANNGLGIAGVAPNVQLMSISNNLVQEPLVGQRLSNGINFAWQNGADVINNSWGGNSLPGQDLINDAINLAVTQGRGGLGTIVIFATGNDNSGAINFPSNNPRVIAVGALSMCNQRKSPSSCDGENWGSNFGAGLDVMAPGVLISTTDRQGNLGFNPNTPIHPNNGGTLVATDYADRNYTTWFNGTSAAAPQVSGIAALILSVNPNLTLQQVRNIIESTADKIGNVTYSPGTGEQTGLTWNNEMGYGRVNAFRAVQSAAATFTTASSAVCTGGTSFSLTAPAGATVTWSTTSNLLTSTGATFVFDPNNPNANSIKLYAINDMTRGTAVINVTISTGCATIPLPAKSVWVGRPKLDGTYNGQLLGFSYYEPVDPHPSIIWNTLCKSVEATTNMQISGTSNGTWQRIAANPTNLNWSANGKNINFFFYALNQTSTFRLTASNTCGTVAQDYYFKSIDCGGSGCNQYAVSPNPARTTVSIIVPNIPPPCNAKVSSLSATSPTDGEFQNDLVIQSIRLIDLDGQEKQSQQFSNKTKKIDLDVSKLKKGIYILKISDGKSVEDHRITIE